MDKINITGMNLEEMRLLTQSLGEANYRADQLFNWIYSKQVRSFDSMTNFSLDYRRRIAEIANIGYVRISKLLSSISNQTKKFLFELNDKRYIESVYMKDDKRITLCLSSQVGCSLGCSFCATGRMGFIRNLSAGEIVDQVLYIQQHLNSKATNVVLMGMGEPFLNYNNVLKACDILSDMKGVAISKRKITISTAGVVPRIKQFAKEGYKYKLAISLNAPDQVTRSRLMPINDKYPLSDLIAAAKEYTNASGERITFEYVLINGVNDHPEHAARLKKLLAGFKCKLNIIPYNSTDEKLDTPSEEKINAFVRHFLKMDIIISVRRSKGIDINAACGQLYSQSMSS